MATVMQCDICGKIYDCRDDNVGHPGTFRVNNSEHGLLLGDRTDCCPECTDRIAGFIDILKEGVPYRIYIDGPKGGGKLDD